MTIHRWELHRRFGRHASEDQGRCGRADQQQSEPRQYQDRLHGATPHPALAAVN